MTVSACWFYCSMLHFFVFLNRALAATRTMTAVRRKRPFFYVAF
jgi:hypothetical protein